MNILSQIWVDRLQRLSDSGVCKGFAIDAQENSVGATINCYMKSAEQTKAIKDLISIQNPDLMIGTIYQMKDGGSQYILNLIIDY